MVMPAVPDRVDLEFHVGAGRVALKKINGGLLNLQQIPVVREYCYNL